MLAIIVKYVAAQPIALKNVVAEPSFLSTKKRKSLQRENKPRQY
jgi:hypothetical protein